MLLCAVVAFGRTWQVVLLIFVRGRCHVKLGNSLNVHIWCADIARRNATVAARAPAFDSRRERCRSNFDPRLPWGEGVAAPRHNARVAKVVVAWSYRGRRSHVERRSRALVGSNPEDGRRRRRKWPCRRIAGNDAPARVSSEKAASRLGDAPEQTGHRLQPGFAFVTTSAHRYVVVAEIARMCPGTRWRRHDRPGDIWRCWVSWYHPVAQAPAVSWGLLAMAMVISFSSPHFDGHVFFNW